MEDSLIGPKYTFSQKGFFNIYKICKNIYQDNSLHYNTKISMESHNSIFNILFFQLIVGIARNSKVLISVKS